MAAEHEHMENDGRWLVMGLRRVLGERLDSEGDKELGL